MQAPIPFMTQKVRDVLNGFLSIIGLDGGHRENVSKLARVFEVIEREFLPVTAPL